MKYDSSHLSHYCIFFVIVTSSSIQLSDAQFLRFGETADSANTNSIPSWRQNPSPIDRTYTFNRFSDHTSSDNLLEQHKRMKELDKLLKDAEIRNEHHRRYHQTWNHAYPKQPEQFTESNTEIPPPEVGSADETGVAVVMAAVAFGLFIFVVFVIVACTRAIRKKRRGAALRADLVRAFLQNDRSDDSRERAEIEALLEARLNYHIFELFASAMLNRMQQEQVQDEHNQGNDAEDKPPSYGDLCDEAPPPSYVTVVLEN